MVLITLVCIAGVKFLESNTETNKKYLVNAQIMAFLSLGKSGYFFYFQQYFGFKLLNHIQVFINYLHLQFSLVGLLWKFIWCSCNTSVSLAPYVQFEANCVTWYFDTVETTQDQNNSISCIDPSLPLSCSWLWVSHSNFLGPNVSHSICLYVYLCIYTHIYSFIIIY